MSARGIDRAEIDRIAARINGMYRNRPDPRPSVTRGTVQAVGEYTYDVLMPDGAVLLGVKRTVGAAGAAVGSECIIEWIAGSAYVTGVVATADSSHYVSHVGMMIFLKDGLTPSDCGWSGTWERKQLFITSTGYMVMDIRNGSQVAETPIQLFHYTGNENQQWHFFVAGEGSAQYYAWVCTAS